MIDLRNVRERIERLQLFNRVGTITTAADAMENEQFIPPAAFVSTAFERAAPNRLSTGRHRQLVQQGISVLWVQGAERADAEPVDVVDDTRRRLILDLIGWRPVGADMPLQYQSFSVPLIGGGLIWSELVFNGSYVLVKDA